MEDYPSVAVARLRDMVDRYGPHMIKQVDRYSSGESLLLRLLSLNNGPVQPSELRRRACTSSARVAAILGALEKKGLIAREVDRQDRRRILVTITDEGQERAEREIADMSANLETVFKALGKTDTEEFIRILERLFSVFVRSKDEPSGDEAGSETSQKQGANR
jgi:DNA-binding MarR family transcriptional regulator